MGDILKVNQPKILFFTLMLFASLMIIKCRDLVGEPVDGLEKKCNLSLNGTLEENETLSIVGTCNPERVTLVRLKWDLVTRIPRIIFDKFPNLEAVSITFSEITIIRRGDFVNAKKVVSFGIMTNPIVDIEDYAFKGMKQAYRLMLMKNKLKIIRRYTFEGLINVECLDLSQNQIEIIQDGAFNLPKLKTLKLNENRLKVLTKSVFAILPPLNTLKASKNNLTEISQLLDNFKELEMLKLDENPISDLNFTMFSRFVGLYELWMGHTDFSSSEKDVIMAEKAESKLEMIQVAEDQLSDEFLQNISRVFKQLQTLVIKNSNTEVNVTDEQVKGHMPYVYIIRY